MHAGLKKMWRQLAAIVQKLTAIGWNPHRSGTTEGHTFICKDSYLQSFISTPAHLFLSELLSQFADQTSAQKWKESQVCFAQNVCLRENKG